MKKLALLFALIALPLTVRAGSTIDNTNAFAWGQNIGWINWHGSDVGQPPGTYGVNIGEYIVQGWIWGPNVGWISMCRKDGAVPPNDVAPTNNIQYSNTGSDYGINYTIDSTTPGIAYLRGFAYGANIGWINFDSPTHPFPGGILKPQISLFTGRIIGYAWSETCGWINLGDTSLNPLPNLETDHVLNGVDSDGDGIADAFEFFYTTPDSLLVMNGTTDTDHDGVLDIDEYREGTDPNLFGDRLRVTAFSTNTAGTSSPITFTSTAARLYMVETKAAMTDLTWSPDPTVGLGVPFAPDAGATTSKTLTAVTATKRFYHVKSIRPLP